ncbi:MAG: EFR1 family ferrodoxin [Methanolinea sp.]|nr:EFR1 family ferrodoxin [Methanolinea sp.]
MGTILYYFTGTGNSLAVARELSSVIGDCKLVPIVSEMKKGGPIEPRADRVGIVNPLYFFGLPSIVAEFAQRLDLSHAGYTFSVITLGGWGASAAFSQLDRILKGRPGKRGLDAAFSIRMPGNYILMYDSPDTESVERILKKSGSLIKETGEMVKAGKKVSSAWSPAAALVHYMVYPRFIRHVHGADAQFSVDDRCNGCGTCARVCPVDNIRIGNDRPAWLHHCEQCMACIQCCPANAIQAEKTEGRRRYRHPGITLNDLTKQRSDSIIPHHEWETE